MAQVKFLSSKPALRVLVGYRDDSGRPVYAQFVNGVFETDEPVFIDALLGLPAHEVRPAPGTPLFRCDECGRFFKTQFALDGHAKSHDKTEG